MRAMILEAPGHPLRAAAPTTPRPGPGQVLLRVLACGVCRTDLHVADGELPDPKLPLVLGHEIVGEVLDRGPGAERYAADERYRTRDVAAGPLQRPERLADDS